MTLSPFESLERAFSSGLLHDGDALLVAVSGGLDSMALLHLVLKASATRKLHVTVGHVDHRLRGSESDADRRFVRSAARTLGLRSLTQIVDVPSLHARSGASLEETARTARYDALERMRLASGARVILTAHHADDQVETVLMRVLRGASARGLAGIPPTRSTPPVVRPLLGVWRSSLLDFVRHNGITFRDDESNRDERFLRNRVRHSVVSKMSPGSKELVVRMAGAERGLWDSLDGFVTRYLRASQAFESGDEPGERSTPVLTWVRCSHALVLPRSVRLTALAHLFERAGVGPTTKRLERADRLIASRPGTRFTFRSAGISIVRDREDLVFVPTRPTIIERVATLRRGEPLMFATRRISMTGPLPVPRSLATARNEALLDADKVRGDLRVRYWKAGDRFVPLGMPGTKKVSDFLRDEHAPVHTKDRVPVVVHRDRIVWVCGYRLDDRFRVTAKTKRVVQLTIH